MNVIAIVIIYALSIVSFDFQIYEYACMLSFFGISEYPSFNSTASSVIEDTNNTIKGTTMMIPTSIITI